MNLELMAFLTDRNRLWAIDEAVLLGYKDAAERHDGSVIEARAPGSTSQTDGVTAILNISGPIAYKPSIFTALFGGSAVTTIQSQLRQALADDSVKAIVMNFDTPGGTVTGLTELAGEIRAARAMKPIVAHTGSMALSAGYWLASSASEVIATQSAMVGSIGVITAHADVSQQLANEGVKVTIFSAGKHKAAGSPYSPLSDEASADIQSRVDAMYGMFTADVAAGRGTTQDAVQNGYGEARAVFSAEGRKAGMVDRIATMDATLARLGSPQVRGKIMSGARADTDVELAAALAAGDIESAEDIFVNGVGTGTPTGITSNANGDADRLRRLRLR